MENSSENWSNIYDLKPEPRVSDFGWLSPDGLFYKCNYGGHLFLAEEICKQKGWKAEVADYYLEKRNWIHKTRLRWNEPLFPPSQRQMDVLLTWEMETGQTIEWMDTYR